MPDLVSLNTPRLRKLAMEVAAADSGAVVEALSRALRANTTLATLTVRGLAPGQAAALATAVADAPSCCMQALSFGGAELPVAALLGRGVVPLEELDLVGAPGAPPAPPLASEEAAALAALLPRAPALASIHLGATKALAPEAAAALTAALQAAASAGKLKYFNRLDLGSLVPAGSTVVAIDTSGTPLGPIGAALLAHRLMQVRGVVL